VSTTVAGARTEKRKKSTSRDGARQASPSNGAVTSVAVASSSFGSKGSNGVVIEGR
jgi:hypothetical protein